MESKQDRRKLLRTEAPRASSEGNPPPSDLARAGTRWVDRGDPAPLSRWLDRRLKDREPAPALGGPPDWWAVLDALALWFDDRPEDWPEPLDRLAETLLGHALRFSRPDGSAVFESEGRSARRSRLIRFWAARSNDPALETVARWWAPERGRAARSASLSPPPLPAWASERRVLAMLRPDWTAQGDLLAVDHAREAPGSLIELRARGRWLLGPEWSVPDGFEPPRAPRRVEWSTDSRSDALEWTVRSGASRITRSAVLFRGSGAALLSEQITGAGSRLSVSLPLAPGVSASLSDDGSFCQLKAPGLKAHVLPLTLARSAPGGSSGRLILDGRRLVLGLANPGRAVWVPWLVVWDPKRTRRRPVVRPLTVTSRTRPCAPEQAQAFRVGWGQGLDSLVFYRSLGRPDLRTFLGEQTSARFLLGRFNTSGQFSPLLTFS